MEVGRDENVSRGDGILHGPGAPSPFGGAHDGPPGTVYLFGEDHVVELDAEGPAARSRLTITLSGSSPTCNARFNVPWPLRTPRRAGS